MKIFFCIISLIFVQQCFGFFGNYSSLPIGDLAAGMGGAATSLVGDAAASPYYNPATLAKLPGSAFSASVGIYKKFDTVYGKEEDFTQAPLRINQGFFRSLPASTSSVIRYQDKMLALSIVVPDYELYRGDLHNDTTSTTTMTVLDESLWVGLAAAQSIDKDSSMGLTVYYTARSYTRSINDRSVPTTSTAHFYSQEKTMTENAIVPIFGYHKKLDDHWQIGTSFRPQGFKIAGKGSYFSSDMVADSAASPAVTINSVNESDLNVNVIVPMKGSIGITYQPDPSWTWTADLSLYEGSTYDDLKDSKYAARVIRKGVWNGAIGMEKAFREWLKLRLGAYTNFAAHPDPDISLGKYQEDHIDMLGFSANMTFVAGQKIAYTFGGYYNGGRGRAIQRISHVEEAVVKTQHIFTMLVGTSFYF